MKLLNRIRRLLGVAPADATGNWWVIVIVAIILPLAAAVAVSISGVVPWSVATTNKHSANSMTTRKIVVTRPQVKAVPITQQYVCQIRSHRHINIRALEKGFLESIPVRNGQEVKTGDLIVKAVPIHYQAKRDVTLAESKLAQLESTKLDEDIENNVFGENTKERLEAKREKVQADQNLATAKLNSSNITAPFDGVIDSLHYQQGSLVEEGEILATLSDNSQLHVYFNVPEKVYLEYMTNVSQRKDELDIELVMANGKKFGRVGKLAAIEADFNSSTGTIPFRADFPNPDRLLRHGQSGNVLINRVLNNAIVIPQRATFEVLNKRYVYVVDKDNVAHQREIVIEDELEDFFVVKTGVSVDDRIILEETRRVQDGEKIELKDRDLKKG